MAATNLPNSRPQAWQTPMNRGGTGMDIYPQQQETRRDIYPDNYNPAVTGSRPQAWQTPTNRGGTGMDIYPEGYVQASTQSLPQDLPQDNLGVNQLNQDMQPLEGEFIPSQMAETQFDMYAPEGNYGLQGAEDAISQGLAGQVGAYTGGTYDAINAINRGAEQGRRDLTGQIGSGINSLRAGIATGRGDINAATDQAVSRFDPYSQTGQSALDVEAARSGALGAEAQRAAFESYNESPGQEWNRLQQERSLIRNAAATGGTQSGNVLTALQQQASGIASQNYQQDLMNLRSLAERGQSAAGSQAGIETQAGRDLAQMEMAGGQSILNARTQEGSSLANMAMQSGMTEGQLLNSLGMSTGGAYGQAGTNVSSLRSQAGRDIASQIASSGGALSNLQSGLGTNFANMDQQTAQLLSQLSQNQGTQTSGLRGQLATILSNLATGNASNQQNYALASGDAAAGGVTNPWGNTASTLAGAATSIIPALAGSIAQTPQTQQPISNDYTGSAYQNWVGNQ